MRYGIPTTYRSVNFRSRLEARWAAFFDYVGWPWAYEPIDLDGYIPDFVLRFEAGPIVVEVKPILAFEELEPHAKRIAAAGWKGKSIVVGAVIWDNDIIGAGQQSPGDYRGNLDFMEWQMFVCNRCDTTSLKSFHGDWSCSLRGCYDGDRYVDELLPGELDHAWAVAGNRVQWRGVSNGAR